MRSEYLIDREKEYQLIRKVSSDLQTFYPDLNAGNTLVIMVSPDYSATVAMHLAHDLSHDGEMADLMSVDVPYPDQHKEPFVNIAANKFMEQLIRSSNHHYQNVLLVEAAVIRGSNYQWLTALINELLETNIVTATMLENTRSVFKSDVVGEYYDKEEQDVTFYYERYNKHWL